MPSERPALDVRALRERRPIWHPDLPFVVLWSQKAACTAVVRWTFFQLGLLEEALAFHPFVHRWELAVFKRRPGYLDGCHGKLLAGAPALKFVRDPAARAYSSYLGACSPSSVRLQGSWFYRTRAAVVAALGSSVHETPFTFGEFLDAVEKIGHDELDNHVSCQFVRYEEALEVEVVPVESFPVALDRLAEAHGLKLLKDGPADLLESDHHRPKRRDLYGEVLIARLAEPLAPVAGALDDLPTVDTARLAGTALGRRVREVFARDYAAYRCYGG